MFFSFIELLMKIALTMLFGMVLIAFIIWLNCGSHVADRPAGCHSKPVDPVISRIIYGDYYQVFAPVIIADE